MNFTSCQTGEEKTRRGSLPERERERVRRWRERETVNGQVEERKNKMILFGKEEEEKSWKVDGYEAQSHHHE